jgi:hypothetical protein
MIVIEMCAYLSSHATDDTPWRCVACDKISKHAEEGIMRHLTEDHGLDAKRLKKEHKDGIFLYPEKSVSGSAASNTH